MVRGRTIKRSQIREREYRKKDKKRARDWRKNRSRSRDRKEQKRHRDIRAKDADSRGNSQDTENGNKKLGKDREQMRLEMKMKSGEQRRSKRIFKHWGKRMKKR